MELVTCVGSAEALKAAVHCGADAVRVALKDRAAAGLPLSELEKAAVYCRVRGVRLYVSLPLPVPDKDFDAMLDTAARLCAAGADALVVGDLGLMQALRQTLPDTALQATGSLAVHDTAGAAALASLGVRRLLLPPQLPGEAVKRLSRARLETEAVVYGPVCPAWGSCGLHAFYGGRAAAAFGCGEECRTRLKGEGGGLYAVDLSLAGELPALAELGLTALCIRGEGRRPEYAAMATDIFHRALRDGKPPSQRDLRLLAESFSPGGVSAGYYQGAPESVPAAPPPRHGRGSGLGGGLLGAVRADYSGDEFQRVPVRLSAEVRRGVFARVTAEDEQGNSASATGPVPARAGEGRRELTAAQLRTQLLNTLGTPYLCEDAVAQAEPGLYLSGAELSLMRREALNRLTALRAQPPVIRREPLPPLPKAEPRGGAPDVTVAVRKLAQLSPALAALKPKVLYVPLAELSAAPAAVTPFWENGETVICAVLPPVIPDSEAAETYRQLRALREVHVEQAQASALGQLLAARRLGFTVRCGPGLAAANERTLLALRELGAVSALLSPALPLSQLGAMGKYLDTELFAYGRLPLLTVERWPDGGQLRDRLGRVYPAVRLGQSRACLLGPDKLFLGDRLRDLDGLGLWRLRLSFTTETAETCAAITARYLELGSGEPNSKTRGRYYENKAGIGLRLPKKKGPAGDAGRL